MILFRFWFLMFPYINIWWIDIHMTGIGFFVALCMLIYSIWYYTRQYGLSFHDFFQTIPVLISLPYILWWWSYIMIEHNILYPANMQDFINMIAPFGYKFHFIGIVLWFVIYIWRFLYTYTDSINTKKRRIDTFVVSICIACIPLWFFLLLGDDFIGKENQYGLFSVASLVSDSELSKYVKVYPLWLWLSLIGLSWRLWFSILKVFSKKSGVWLISASYVFLLLSILFVFQIYPRHGVYTISEGIILDIKNYICIVLGIACVLYYMYLKSQK